MIIEFVKQYWLFLLLIGIVIISLIAFFVFLRFNYLRMQKRLVCYIYFNTGDSERVNAKVTDKEIRFNGERYLIEAENIRKRFFKSKIEYYINFIKGIPEGFIIKDPSKKPTYLNAETVDVLMENKLIRELAELGKDDSKIPLRLLIAGGVIVVVVIILFVTGGIQI